MDVVLINDCANPFLHRYLGPYKVADSLRKVGYTVQVIDFVSQMSKDTLLKYLRKFVDNNTLMVGVSGTFLAQFVQQQTQNGVTRRVPEHIRDALLELKVDFRKPKYVLGGYNSEHLDGFGVIDARVISNAEAIVVELVDFYAGRGEEPNFTLEMPMWGRTLQKNYVSAKSVVYNIEVDSFKFTEQDCIVEGETLPLEMSRGCVFKCKFCNHENLGRGKLDYLRSIECVKEELLSNFSKWGTTRYNIVCDTFNDTEYKVKLWHDMLAQLPFKIHYSAYIRADLLHRFPDTPIMLQESGMFSCFHGIETLHSEASKIIGKAWSGKHAREWIPKLYHDIWGGKVYQHLNFIAGLTGETREDIRDTFEWWRENYMSSIWFGTLALMEKGYRHQSEFERNTSQYGYSFITGPNTANRYWKNDYWDFKQAESFLNTDIRPTLWKTSGNDSWDVQSLIGFGMPIEEAILPRTKVSSTRVAEFNHLFMMKYMKKLDEISA